MGLRPKSAYGLWGGDNSDVECECLCTRQAALEFFVQIKQRSVRSVMMWR